MMFHTLIICALVGTFGLSFSDAQDEDREWGYHHEHGEIPPEEWAGIEGSFCGGPSQSPIDIVTSEAVEQEFSPWVLEGYTDNQPGGPQVTSIYNNGHGVTVNLVGDYLVRGGGLPTTYKGFEFFLHYGENFLHGSEHTKDGYQYPAELYVVHYDTQYDSFDTAVTSPQGLAVFSFFLDAGDHNEAWAPIIASLSEVQHVGDEYVFQENIKLSALMPGDLSRFYRYQGSMTTPPCEEAAVYSVFESTIKLSLQQLAALRIVSEKNYPGDPDSDHTVTDNHRPIQPLNGRTVYAGYAAPAGSCVGRCGEYNEELQCQCNSVCSGKGDCCPDYREQCFVEVCSYVPTFGKKQRRKQSNPAE